LFWRYPVKPISLVFLFVVSLVSIAQEVGGPNLTSVPVAVAPPVVKGTTPVQIRKGILLGALDPLGSPVGDLNKDQIQIMDSGHAATPLMVRKADQLPLDLGIVLYADSATFSQQQAAAIELVKKTIRPEVDHAFVISAGGNKPWSDGNLTWQNDLEALTKTIQGLDKSTGFSDPFGYEIVRTATGLGRDTLQKFGGGNGSPDVFGVIWEMMKSDARPVRKAVIIFRKAWAHSPGTSGRYSPMVEALLANVIGNAQSLGIPLYAIGLEDLSVGAATTNIGVVTTGVHSGDAAELRGADDELEKLRKAAYDAGRSNVMRIADSTGGHVWWSSKRNFSDATDGIVKDVLGQYILIFSPSGVDAGSPRALRVTTSHKDCRLETPTAFYLAAH
jgi:VWFA-related protein